MTASVDSHFTGPASTSLPFSQITDYGNEINWKKPDLSADCYRLSNSIIAGAGGDSPQRHNNPPGSSGKLPSAATKLSALSVSLQISGGKSLTDLEDVEQ
ncbi:hypothetical protein RRG08_001654 [Elysia crispata]|uniref:Uncharacterized protein n=1 Tax=Elysia crispata TaxID=231223 RepID=A0AAE1AK17_9GAST|nr:hypothetical protein RRG08_001654 [Elysia crispata]